MRLIDDWKTAHKKFSVWFFIIIAIAPDFYNAIMAAGLLDQAPQPLIWIIRSLAAGGILSRLIKQGDKNESIGDNKTIS